MCADGELRFYCATPLICASGRRLGTLCAPCASKMSLRAMAMN